MDEESKPLPLELRLRSHVEMLAGQIGERNVFRPGSLRQAIDYLQSTWKEMGYQVQPQKFLVHNIECVNLEVLRKRPSADQALVIVGAHYDSVVGSPGANDNATGVAAMLEISRRFAPASPSDRHELRFLAFVNEEPPFFDTDHMGSRVYARQLRQDRKQVRAMLSLETVGFYSEQKGSQRYPPLFGLFYPNRANFIAFVANLCSRSLVRQATLSFKQSSEFPVESTCTFSFVPGVSWSDHGSFWREGYPALMVTDTAFYRYPHYHTTQDTPDKVDYEKLARVTEGLCQVVQRLVESP